VLTGFLYRRISVDKAGPNLLDPAQDRASADVDAAVGQDAGDTLGRGAQLEVITDGQQNDITREAMAGYQARRLTGCVSTTGAADAYGTASLVMAIAGQV
jgi:hypothetical protein